MILFVHSNIVTNTYVDFSINDSNNCFDNYYSFLFNNNRYLHRWSQTFIIRLSIFLFYSYYKLTKRKEKEKIKRDRRFLLDIRPRSRCFVRWYRKFGIRYRQDYNVDIMHLIFSQSMTEGRITVVHVVFLLSTTPNVYYSRVVRFRLFG